MYKKLKVSQRLAMSSAALILLLLSVVGTALYGMSKLHASTDEINSNWLPSIKLLGAMNLAKSDLRLYEWRHITSLNTAEMSEVEQRMAAKLEEFDKLKDEYTKIISNAEERALYDAFIEAWRQYVTQHNLLLALSRENKNAEARDLMRGDGRKYFDASAEALQKSVDFNQKGADSEGVNSARVYGESRTLLVLLAVLATSLAATLSWLTVRSISRELGGEPSEAQTVASAIAAGNLTSSIHVRQGDEVSVMARLATMQDSLRRVVSQVRDNSESVATASAQIAQGNADLSHRTEEQASALQQTAATMAQLNTTVRSNTDSAKQANQLAQGASAVASQGGEVVSQVVDKMRGISESSRRIAEIIGMIDSIAFQTNILALNAAVEAARAGEQGRGFAVVAGEVRTLAQRSADAAKQITSLIGSSVEQVEQGTLLVDRAGSTMSEIVDSIRRVSDMVAEITAASMEQSSGISQVGDAVVQMDQVTQQNAALVEESAAAAESLRTQARQLVQSVALFKLSDEHVASTH